MNNKSINDIKDIFNNLIDLYELDYGNGYFEEYNNSYEWVVEAPNNSTMCVSFHNKLKTKIDHLFEQRKIEEIIKLIKNEYNLNLYYFDPDEIFDELWCYDFKKHNNFTASQFINMLLEDKEYFKKINEEMKKDVIIYE